MEFLFPENAVASLLIYKLELLKLNLVSLPWKKATEQLMKGHLKQIIKNLINLDFSFKIYKPRNHSMYQYFFSSH